MTLSPDLEHLPEALMADDQMLAARRSIAVKCLVDLAIGRVDTDLEHLHQHRPALGYAANVGMGLVGQLRDRDVSQVDAIRLTRQNGNGFHQGVCPS